VTHGTRADGLPRRARDPHAATRRTRYHGAPRSYETVDLHTPASANVEGDEDDDPSGPTQERRVAVLSTTRSVATVRVRLAGSPHRHALLRRRRVRFGFDGIAGRGFGCGLTRRGHALGRLRGRGRWARGRATAAGSHEREQGEGECVHEAHAVTVRPRGAGAPDRVACLVRANASSRRTPASGEQSAIHVVVTRLRLRLANPQVRARLRSTPR
jgi:hypothetical protein